MPKRHPGTPDCAIRGCSKAARQLGLCSEHHALIPERSALAAYMEGLKAQMRAVARVHREAARYVENELRVRALDG